MYDIWNYNTYWQIDIHYDVHTQVGLPCNVRIMIGLIRTHMEIRNNIIMLVPMWTILFKHATWFIFMNRYWIIDLKRLAYTRETGGNC